MDRIGFRNFVAVSDHELDAVMEAANWATTPGQLNSLSKSIECAIDAFNRNRDPYCYAADLPPLRVGSIREMVHGVTRLCEISKSWVATLRIIGHGTQGYMHIGKDIIGYVQDVVAQQTKLRLNEYKIDLELLKPHFCKGAKVVLEGCKIGHNDELLGELSFLWPSVTIIAMTSNQRTLIPGREGGVVTCKNGSLSYSPIEDYELIDRALESIDRYMGL